MRCLQSIPYLVQRPKPQVRSHSWVTDLSLLHSFVLSVAGVRAAVGEGDV